MAWPWPAGPYWGSHDRFVIGANPGDHDEDIVREHIFEADDILLGVDCRVDIAQEADKSDVADALKRAMEAFIRWAQWMPFLPFGDAKWRRPMDNPPIPAYTYVGAQVRFRSNPKTLVWGTGSDDLISDNAQFGFGVNKLVLVDVIQYFYGWTGDFPGTPYPGWECRCLQAMQRAKERIIELESMEDG